VELDFDSTLPPSRAGRYLTESKRILFHPENFKLSSLSPEDVATHEFMHRAQEYSYEMITKYKWLAEGIADYGMEEYSPNDTLSPLKPEDHYTYGYDPAARFLGSLEKMHPGIVDKINCALQNENFTINDFYQWTGKTVDQLWEEFRSKELASQQSQEFGELKDDFWEEKQQLQAFWAEYDKSIAFTGIAAGAVIGAIIGLVIERACRTQTSHIRQTSESSSSSTDSTSKSDASIDTNQEHTLVQQTQQPEVLQVPQRRILPKRKARKDAKKKLQEPPKE